MKEKKFYANLTVYKNESIGGIFITYKETGSKNEK